MNGFRFGSSALSGVAVHHFGARNVGVGVELAHRPVGLGEHNEPELIQPGGSRRCRPTRVGPAQLAARKKAGDLASRVVILHRRINELRCFHLRRAQAVRFRQRSCTAASRDRICTASGSRAGRPLRRQARRRPRRPRDAAAGAAAAGGEPPGCPRALCAMRTAWAARPVQSRPGAPAMMPSKSAGKRWASAIACRPPAEQPFQ